jgi:hypothetical protein
MDRALLPSGRALLPSERALVLLGKTTLRSRKTPLPTETSALPTGKTGPAGSSRMRGLELIEDLDSAQQLAGTHALRAAPLRSRFGSEAREAKRVKRSA